MTLDVQARKVVADSAGIETEVPMYEWTEDGIFATVKGGERVEPLYLQKHHIISGKRQIKVSVPGKPTCAGIDPYKLLTDTVGGDNVEEVKLE